MPGPLVTFLSINISSYLVKGYVVPSGECLVDVNVMENIVQCVWGLTKHQLSPVQWPMRHTK